jgi:hypothetical protein
MGAGFVLDSPGTIGTPPIIAVCLKEQQGFLLAFSIPGFAPDEPRSSTQPNSGTVMSLLNRKSDVKNHLSVRHYKANHLYRPLSQPDEQVIAPPDPDAIKANLSDFAEDFNVEHSSSGRSIASNDGLTLSVDPQPSLPPRSVQE